VLQRQHAGRERGAVGDDIDLDGIVGRKPAIVAAVAAMLQVSACRRRKKIVWPVPAPNCSSRSPDALMSSAPTPPTAPCSVSVLRSR